MEAAVPDDGLKAIVRRLASQIAEGRYDFVVREVASSRLTSEDLRQVVRDYGRTLIVPPSEAYGHLDIVRVRDTVPTWSIRVPLWTAEEGRSDLTLELTISFADEIPVVELDDLHVL
jgi:hypothetical protein